jgi:hypothetical protein
VSSITFSNVAQMGLIIGRRDKNELRSLDHFLKRFQLIHINKQISDTATDLLKKHRRLKT